MAPFLFVQKNPGEIYPMDQDLSYFRNFGEQIEQRLNKLDNFAQRNELSYPPRVIRNHTAAKAIELFEATDAARPENSEDDLPEIKVEVAGRLVAVRNMGKSTFVHIEDGTGRLQLYLR